MIKRLLVANRGEIALRIIRACCELGIESVAVYSDADAHAPHVAAANAAVWIGPAPAVDSYLSIPHLLEAARARGCDAVHPGYGFLSERASFAEACERAGIVFVGPPSAVIAQMGSKITARRLMQSAGVPVVPGATPRDQTDASLERTVSDVGLPVLVKASAGGGGHGMRRVDRAGDTLGAIQAARREAVAAFGDGTLYVEKVIERARHIEVQVFADNRGHVVHLFERECSVQRRHQKVIEESPSPVVPPRLRSRMADTAVRAARACGYRNAGTVEFLVDTSGGRGAERFFFLEMNTRLQVEHPVTELVTGLDLVRTQLLVASNEPLPWTSPGINQRGHAIEARVYAEDPQHDFLPQAGHVLLYREPRFPGVRIDSGIREASDVPVDYDPLLAKVIAAASTREEALARLVCALREYAILGVRTNIPFLLRILEHPRFRAGEVDAGFLDAEGASLAASPDVEAPSFIREVFAAYRADLQESPVVSKPPTSRNPVLDPWDRLTTWRP